MLRYIQRQADAYAIRHGVRPNVVYVNHQHWQALFQLDTGMSCRADIVQEVLALHVILQDELTHPRIGLMNLQTH